MKESCSNNKHTDGPDPVVCFCYRLTEKRLRDAYKECGSLEQLKEHTRAGTACRGCLSSLSAMFNENDTWHTDHSRASSCVYSGQTIMKVLVVSVDGLETRALAANAPAPQLGTCNLDGNVSYIVIDGAGQPVIQRQQPISTFHNFVFDTARENLPKPFVGQIMYELDRKNRGGGRLGAQWYSPHGIAATHEIASSGRPRVFVPVPLDPEFLNGPNRMYLALVNPHGTMNPFELNVFTREKITVAQGTGTMGPYHTMWVDVEDSFIKPLRGSLGKETLFIGLQTTSYEIHSALSCYFFVHNLNTGAWSCQHL